MPSKEGIQTLTVTNISIATNIFIADLNCFKSKQNNKLLYIRVQTILQSLT